MSHIASKTAAELTCSNPYACFPKHNILGTYSLNCLQGLGTTQMQPRERASSISGALPERPGSVLAPAGNTVPYGHQAVTAWQMALKLMLEGGIICITEIPWNPNWDQIPAASTKEIAPRVQVGY